MTEAQPLFEGVGVALVSLFDDDERLLVDATADHAARLADEGVRAILVAGSTGEAWFLTADERAALCGATRAAVPDRVPVLVGTGHPDTSVAVRMTIAARDAGADAVIAISPEGQDDPTAYYEAVAEAADGLPLLAYHYPKVSSPGIRVELLEGLPVAGLKDSSGDAERLAAELGAYSGPLYVGSALLAATAGMFGAAGAILALANLDVARCTAAFAGDADAQRALMADHVAVMSDFPRRLKLMLAERHGTSAAVRTRMPAGAAAL